MVQPGMPVVEPLATPHFRMYRLSEEERDATANLAHHGRFRSPSRSSGKPVGILEKEGQGQAKYSADLH